LVSAYDVFYERRLEDFSIVDALTVNGLPLVFLDSGGYEALWNAQAREAGLIEAADAQPWSSDLHGRVLDDWPPALPVMAVTYDNVGDPSESISDQIERAEEMGARWPAHGREILLKPPPGDFLTVSVVRAHALRLAGFDVIGVTEKECGASMADRILFISELRRALDDAEAQTPIHVFGGLDPYMTPLYFFAGADIFDGLTWLRYAFHSGLALYAQSYTAKEMPLLSMDDALWEMRQGNYREMTDLQIAMQRFILNRDPAVFGSHGEHLIGTYKDCLGEAAG
jgi:hypothetical protein